nr:HlyD family efflux transporter periplasmic adaptor subunit [Bacilli bacterium]
MAGNNVIRLIAIQIITIIVLAALLFGGYIYYTNSINYVTSTDAQVDGTIVPITVPLSGTLSSWNGSVNTTVNAGDVLGMESNGSVLATNPSLVPLYKNKKMKAKINNAEMITSPITGTVIQNNATNGQMVQPGQILADVVNLNSLYITANIPETEIRHVSVGQRVDVNIDGIPNTTFQGTVEQIGNVTQSVFSLVPNVTTASGSYTKVLQRVPVKISLGNYSGKPLLPGMSAEVTIHVNNNN